MPDVLVATVLCAHAVGGTLQDAAIREHTERLSAAAQAARQLVRKQDTVLKERVEQVLPVTYIEIAHFNDPAPSQTYEPTHRHRHLLL